MKFEKYLLQFEMRMAYFTLYRNFLVTNKRFHTNMSSIVLAQSGLYSAVSVLALNRGAQLDVFCALIGVVNQQFGRCQL